MAKTNTIDLFATAQAEAVVVPEKKSKKAEKPGVEMGEALAQVAAIDFIMESLKGQRSEFESTVKEEMQDHFIQEGIALKHRPANFKGVAGGFASASCELRKRSTASVLSDEEVSELIKVGIEVEEVEVRPEAFLFNPEVLADVKLREKVSKALAGIDFGGLQPILYQAPEKKFVANETMIDKVFSEIKNKKIVAKLLSMVTVLGVKSKWTGTKSQALELLTGE